MRRKWSGNINYVEICSGPGRSIARNSGLEMDGTPLAIVQQPEFSHLHRAVFVDANQRVVDALNARLNACRASHKARAFLGDYNDPEGIVSRLLDFDVKGLTLLFVDPTDCSVPFSLVKVLKERLTHVDLIMNVAVGTDVARNVKLAVRRPASKVRAKYERFLGTTEFFNDPAVIALACDGVDRELRLSFMNAYVQQLSSIGLTHHDAKRVKWFYWLVFASANARGMDFWRKINLVTHDKQRLLL